MMPMGKVFVSIILIVCVTFFTRAVPFILFDKKERDVPEMVLYLGKYLPPALICIILVYCFQDLYVLRGLQLPGLLSDLKEAVAVLVVVMLHVWKKNTMLSIFAGTAVYMALVQI